MSHIVYCESIGETGEMVEGDTRPSKRLYDRTVGTDLEACLGTEYNVPQCNPLPDWTL